MASTTCITQASYIVSAAASANLQLSQQMLVKVLVMDESISP